MAYDLLTTSGIDGLVTNYKNTEANNRLTPLTTRRTNYQTLDSAYTTINTKLTAFSSSLNSLASTDSTSTFSSMRATSSSAAFFSISATSTAVSNTSTVRVNQLAKNDLVLSQDLASDTASTVITEAGSHDFVITSGDGLGGTLTSKVTVTFSESDFTNGTISNADVMTKIQTAINTDKAIVNSGSVAGDTETTEGSFKLNLNGTETTINYSAGTYSDVLDSVASQINALSGITAEKIADGPDNFKLQITVTDTSKYISIGNDITGTLVNDLGIASPNTKEISTSAVANASVFTPVSGYSQFSLTTDQSGFDYRIMSLDDSVGGSALASLGLNLGAARTSFEQISNDIDTAGYAYASSTLNAKLEYNGISIERNSNSISDLIPGSKIALNAVMQPTDPTVNISVTRDTTAVKTAINNFISKFNDLYTYLKTNLTSSTNGTTTTRGSLTGDSTATTLQSFFSSLSTSTVSGIPTDQINTLYKLGIKFDITSGLSLADSTVLDSSLNNKPDQVAALFNSTNGIAKTFSTRIAPYLGSTGYIMTRKATFTSNIASITDTGTAIQAKIDKSAVLLRSRYIKMQQDLQTILYLQSDFATFYSGLLASTTSNSTTTSS
ncbi:MAG: flagellar filament capping protein FliD [Ignavibacteriales bacterium]|nr:flagellar filament capping protein FliD [Ignavibacteriales bacterium]